MQFRNIWKSYEKLAGLAANATTEKELDAVKVKFPTFVGAKSGHPTC